MTIKHKHRFDDGGGASKINLSALGQAAGNIGGVFGTLIDAATFDPSTMGAEDRVHLEAMKDLDFNATDYGDLYAQVSGLSPIENNFKASDYYKEKSGLDYFLDFNKDTLAGAGTGASIGGPWGALIGGIVGSVSNIAGSILGHNKKKEGAKKAAEDNTALADSVNRALSLKISNSANNLNTQNVSNMLLHTGAFGGILETKGASWNSGASFIDNGGTHQENPFGGVQYGIAYDGAPNLVEQGEVVIDLEDNTDANHMFTYGGSPNTSKFVISDKVLINEKERDLLNKLTDNPDKYIGKSYAYAYRDLFKRNGIDEKANNPETKDYLRVFNSRFAETQEMAKDREDNETFVKEFNKSTPEEQKFLLQQAIENGYIPEEEAVGYAARGGKIRIKPENRGKFTATKKRTGKTTEELTHSKNPLTRKRAIFAQNAKKFKHADGGHLFVMGGPDENEFRWSFYNNNNNDFYFPYIHYATDKNKPMTLHEAPWYYTLLNTDTAQDHVNKNIPIKIIEPVKRVENQDNQDNPVVENIVVPNTLNESIDRLHGIAFGDLSQNEERENTSVYPTWTRVSAPLAGNLIGLGYTLTHTPDNKYADQYEQAAKDYVNNIREVGYTPLSEELTYKPIDTAYYINELLSSQAANRNALINLSNGNPNVTAANLLASNYNSNIELGKLMREAELADLERREKSLAFNRETHRLNRDAAMNTAIQNANIRTNKANTLLNTKLRALGWRRDDIANWENNLGSNLTNLFDNLGNIGLENYNRNTMMSNPSLYYYTDEDGIMHYKKGLSKKQKEIAESYAKENNLEVKG